MHSRRARVLSNYLNVAIKTTIYINYRYVYVKDKYKLIFSMDYLLMYKLMNYSLEYKTEVKWMRKVITYGSFDLLHYGHISLLKRAKQMGDYLIVGLSSDEFNTLKNKKSYYSFEHRKVMLEAIRYVDEVIPENTWDQKTEDVKKYNIDVFVMGDDWKGKFDYLKEYCEVVYLPRTLDISTTKVKQILNVNNS